MPDPSQEDVALPRRPLGTPQADDPPTMAAIMVEVMAERDRALVALWRIRMEAERASVNDPPFVLPNAVIAIALGGMGKHKRRAQELAADRLGDAGAHDATN